MFDFISKKEKNISNQELINQLKIETMTLKELLSLREKIINEVTRRNVNTLELPAIYKSFKAVDYSETINNKIISFIIDEYGFLLGVSKCLNLHFGRVDNQKNISIIELETEVPIKENLCFEGTFLPRQKYYIGDYWHRINHSNFLQKQEQQCIDTKIDFFETLEDEKIPDIETLIQHAYQKATKKEKNKILIDKFNNVRQTSKKLIKEKK